ncbi:hypothetical protein PF005_g16126 [Phytophthora fragariae]|uniref:Uncharacterized protein n=1 Tax=Phytophthora fragariae TaxID=53985 RepID=A0A6A3JRJ1_9STRA|nr:hypothetical protein PF003_g19256 [Phytophthora fragariae]KAE8932704.1 hypothetical protein PF009_g17273 [Phytophthora fragariae]KAE8997956.1 hypothetical protein PF011_g15250 [Phytophthora fragariae]KAE9090993.1 hypothetical protein PF006_g25026 [Phytophthora fragariae]KAE9098437.1 hypothetical protein PF007_g16259 [Phytophthora fragariae]
MRDFPPKARGPVLLALGGLRLCLDSGLRARPQIGKCPHGTRENIVSHESCGSEVPSTAGDKSSIAAVSSSVHSFILFA